MPVRRGAARALGTLMNVLRLSQPGKPVAVYAVPEGRFIDLRPAPICMSIALMLSLGDEGSAGPALGAAHRRPDAAAAGRAERRAAVDGRPHRGGVGRPAGGDAEPAGPGVRVRPGGAGADRAGCRPHADAPHTARGRRRSAAGHRRRRAEPRLLAYRGAGAAAGVNDAPFDPARLIRVLLEHGVSFVVIGGVAANLLGSPTVTQDLAICHDRSRANLDALAAALRELRAEPRGVAPGLVP